ncbi:MAG: ABC transporter ATP-binding protein [Spirochaetales bacterium]|nr:ABC transporter ATP-binding protein [Spirochaetales bacterium]
MIRFNNVSRYYSVGEETVKALDGVTFKIDKGDFISISGPSGSGKSTLLSILGILNTPSRGEVIIDDINVYELPPEERADFRSDYIGFIFQAFQLIPYLTALENVMLPLAISPITRKAQEKMAKDVLKQVGLATKFNKLPNQLSGGEIQRVAIARAIVNEPDILLADELTGNLDSKNAEEVMKLIVHLNELGKTIVMVTHEENIAGYARRNLQLFDGRLTNGSTKLQGVLK